MVRCAALEPRGLEVVARTAPNLVDLDVNGCTLVDRADVFRLFAHFAYAAMHDGDLAIRPTAHAGAIERRDSV